MSFSQLRKHLPELNGTVLDFIFNHVYDIVETSSERQALDDDSKLWDLVEVLKVVQRFNWRHRIDEAFALHQKAVIPAGLELQSNSTGSELWLAMLLAIKDLYGLNQHGLITAIKKISVRN